MRLIFVLKTIKARLNELFKREQDRELQRNTNTNKKLNKQINENMITSLIIEQNDNINTKNSINKSHSAFNLNLPNSNATTTTTTSNVINANAVNSAKKYFILF